MIKSNQHITDDLLLSYLRNHVSDEQKKKVEEWLSINDANRRHLEKIRNLWEHSESYTSFKNIDTSGDWKKVSERMGMENRTVTMQPSRKTYLGSLLRIAAIAIVLISIGYLTWNIVVKQGLPAGQLAITTGEETSSIELPDGSTVYLNSFSGLTYPKKFRKNSRLVELRGEAFFEIETDTQKPFIVTSGDASIKVLGTSFNVLFVPGNQTVTVTVTEGKVALFPVRQEDLAIQLIRGEQGIYQDNNLVKYDTIDPNVLSWKTGILKFEQSTLPEVIRSLEKHYNTIIQFHKKTQTDPRLTSVFEDQPLEEVLEELNLLLGLEYQQKNDTIFVQIE